MRGDTDLLLRTGFTLLSAAGRLLPEVSSELSGAVSATSLTKPVVAPIVRAALRMIDRDGVDGLSMRRLGAALGVEGMALYRHVGNKQQLLEGVVEKLPIKWTPKEITVGSQK